MNADKRCRQKPGAQISQLSNADEFQVNYLAVVGGLIVVENTITQVDLKRNLHRSSATEPHARELVQKGDTKKAKVD